MTKQKIGVSGGKGSFSEEAGNYYCQKFDITDYEIEYLITVDNVLKAVSEGTIDKAIFPIENSNGGIVYEAVYAMSRYIFNIERLFEIDIKMNLLVMPGKKAEDIKKIVSQDQALKQCRMYLKRKWPNHEIEQYYDTASAAKDLAAGILSPDCAVIAPFVCAKLYGLDVFEEGTQDLKFNFTTFIAGVK